MLYFSGVVLVMGKYLILAHLLPVLVFEQIITSVVRSGQLVMKGLCCCICDK